MISKEKLISLYTLHNKEIFNYIYKLIGIYEVSEDILHDCYVNLIEYSKKHEIDDTTVKSFLYKTAHNLAINYLKKNQKISYLTEDSDNSLVDSTDEDLQHQEILNEVENALKILDHKTRSIFILKRNNNYTNDEIAKLLGISERTVRRKWQLAISHIISHLKNKGLL